MGYPQPGDLLTLLAEPADPCLGAQGGVTGEVVEVGFGPLPHAIVQWPNGDCSKVYPGIDEFSVKSTFVCCPECGTDRLFDLAQDPETGIVLCGRCGTEYTPRDHQR